MICLPPTIGPIYPSGDILKGIFYELKKYVSNPVSDDIVSLYSTTSQGDINSVVMWDGDWANEIGTNYLEIGFPHYHLFPRNYTLRSASQEWYYAKKWVVYGYNEDERDDQTKWTKLHEGSSSSSVYCGTEERCDGVRTNTFGINQIDPQTNFKYIRFVNIEPSGKNTHFITSGIDFYGYLSIEERISFHNHNICTIMYLIPRFRINNCFFVHISILFYH